MRQIVLDTETTGLSTAQGHRIIEIGAIELSNRRFTGREYHRFLQPDRDIDEGAQRVHGITLADLETAPRFADIIEEFLEFISGAELVIHNAEFDVGFLDHELRLAGHARPRIADHAEVLDTLTLAREMHPGQRNTLDALCKRYEVDASKRDLHGALIDSDLLARVYLAMTGGQAALLLDAEVADQADDVRREQTQTASRSEEHQLLVIAADSNEMAAHEAMLEKIREQGRCVWDDAAT